MEHTNSQGTTTMVQGREANRADNHTRLLEAIREYWNEHIHDLEIAKHPIGTKEFFAELHEYRFDKLHYLPRVVDFSAYKGKRLLEVGCGVGLDLVEFAQHGCVVTGIDLSEQAIELAKKNFAFAGLQGDLRVMNGENVAFDDHSFEAVYAHGVLQYTADANRMVAEIYRVLKPGGEAILMVYNKYSWLNLLSVLFGVGLEHADAPVLNKYSAQQFRDLLSRFSQVDIVFERFPVKSRLHGEGVKGLVFNTIFVPLFNVVPRAVVRQTGWHILAKVKK